LAIFRENQGFVGAVSHAASSWRRSPVTFFSGIGSPSGCAVIF
jgi:hypothetical protein